MQRILIVLVVGLILVIGLGTTTAAKNHPDGYQNPTVYGDDHTWGGEQGWGTGDGGGDVQTSGSIMPWTLVITHVLFEHLFFESTSAMRITGFILSNDEGRDQSQNASQVISSNKGN